MDKYLVLLRAVNVSGKNILKMTSLKEVILLNQFEEVSTYIQSGNIILTSQLDKVETYVSVKKIIKDNFQLEIDVFVIDMQELRIILNNNPYESDEYAPNKVFITLLDHNPSVELLEKFQKINIGDEKFHIVDRTLYYYLPEGMSKSKLTNNFIETKLQTKSTGRNLNTMRKLSEILNT